MNLLRFFTLVLALFALVESRKYDAEIAKRQEEFPPNKSEYFSATGLLSGSLNLYWKIENETIVVALECKGTGWVGFGLGEAMYPAADIIMSSVSEGVVSVTDRWSKGREPPQTDISLGGTSDILSYSGEEVDGVTYIQFVRFLNTGDSWDFEIEEGRRGVLVAHHQTSDDFAIEHTNHDILFVDLFTGESEVSNQVSLRVVHGILMTIAWGVIIVISTFIARFFKWLGHAWFVSHIVLGVVAFLTMIAGLVIAFLMVDQGFFDRDAIAVTHSILGLVVVASAVIVQPLLGWWADRKYDEDRIDIPWYDVLHWWIGRLTLLVALVVIFLGFATLGAEWFWYLIFGLWLLLLVVVFGVLEIRRRRNPD